MAVKSFITLAPVACTVKIFTAVIVTLLPYRNKLECLPLPLPSTSFWNLLVWRPLQDSM